MTYEYEITPLTPAERSKKSPTREYSEKAIKDNLCSARNVMGVKDKEWGKLAMNRWMSRAVRACEKRPAFKKELEEHGIKITLLEEKSDKKA